jgi:phosphoesterase RecJ-like protein
MHLPVPEDLVQAFRAYDKFVLLGHEEPDGDCLGSQMALASFLGRSGGRGGEGAATRLVSPGPFKRNEISHMAGHFSLHIPDDFRDASTLAVVLDCSTLDRIAHLADELGDAKVAVVDHHASGKSFGEIRYIDSDAPSVTYMIQKIMEAMEETPDTYEAELLLFGLATDTGYFRHLETRSAPVFRLAARLVDAGANPKRTHAGMYGGRKLEARRLLGRLLARTESYFDGRLLVTHETLEEKRSYGEENRDSDTLYQHLQGVENCEVVILVREEQPGECSVGLRSNNDIDVGKVAHSFGGGGHAKAAGFSRQGTIEQTVEAVVSELDSRFR